MMEWYHSIDWCRDLCSPPSFINTSIASPGNNQVSISIDELRPYVSHRACINEEQQEEEHYQCACPYSLLILAEFDGQETPYHRLTQGSPLSQLVLRCHLGPLVAL